MVFSGDAFSPQTVSQPQLRALLTTVAAGPDGLVSTTELLAVGFASRDAAVLSALAESIRPIYLAAALAQTLSQRRAAAAGLPPERLHRHDFHPDAVQVLERLSSTYEAANGALDGVAVELFLYFVFTALPVAERQMLPPIDYEYAAASLRARITHSLPSTASPTTTGPDDASDSAEADLFRLAPEIAPSEDLTRRVHAAALPDQLPFDGDPIYDRLFDRVARALHRRQHNHALLIGEPGVGKNTLVVELARRAAVGQIAFLKNARFLNVDCRYFPPDETRARLLAMLQQVSPRPELIVCLEGLATLLRGERGGSNKPLFLAALSQCRCRFMGLLTPREYEELVSDDLEFAEFFTGVVVPEPEGDTALRLLRHFAQGLAARYNTPIDDAAVCRAVQLTALYILNDQLPAKAVKILRRVCEDVAYARSQCLDATASVTEDGVIQAVAEATGVPPETLRGVAEGTDYEQSLNQLIFGQAQAVREVATELGLIKAGMTDGNKPASVMLFLGQTGTGKTELAKALARFYSTSKRLKTYTLGNCVEAHSVATIIGVPPGYVGNEQGGRLVNELNADPYCVFLLDEADKAHPDVLQPFLNLFDEGWVSDQRGVRGYANRSIFILTSNVGQRMIAEMVEQGKTTAEIQSRMKEVLGQIRHSKADRPVFTPEFIARIKRIIVFNPLSREAMLGITKKLINEMQATWQEQRGKELTINARLVEHTGERAHQLNEKAQGREGGRIVRKLVADWIEAPLQRRISQEPHAYRGCRTVRVDWHAVPGGSGAETAAAPQVIIEFVTARADSVGNSDARE